MLKFQNSSSDFKGVTWNVYRDCEEIRQRDFYDKSCLSKNKTKKKRKYFFSLNTTSSASIFVLDKYSLKWLCRAKNYIKKN